MNWLIGSWLVMTCLLSWHGHALADITPIDNIIPELAEIEEKAKALEEKEAAAKQDVVEEVKKSIPNAELLLHKNSSGKYHVNLWEANRQILLENGLSEKHIEILGECSFTQGSKYFSARKEGIDTGRMVSGIMILR